MSASSRRMALAIALLFALSFTLAPGDEAAAQQGQKPVRAQKPGNGGGKGGGGNGGGGTATYSVDVFFDGGVSAGSTVPGLVDDAYSLLENEGSNPAPDYYLGAEMQAPPSGTGLVEMTIEFADIPLPSPVPTGAMTCGDFFVNQGDGDGLNGLPDVTYDYVNGTGTWTGMAHVFVNLDEGTSVDDPQLGWRDLNTTGPRAAKVRMDGFLQTERKKGKKTTVESALLFTLRFDDDWQPPVDVYSDSYDALGARADDLEALSTGADATGNSTSWWVTNGSTGTKALVHNHSSTDGALALCNVSVSWSAAVQ